jgi:acetyl-CoA acetyltransferase
MQTDPYYTIPLWPSMSDMAGLSARAYLDRTGKTERDLVEVAARAQRNGAGNPNSVRADAKADAGALLASSPYVSDPLRECDVFPVSDGATAVVIAADDVARRACERPAWIRGLDHRIDAHALGVRDLSTSASTRLAGERAGAQGAFDVAELHAQFSHEELLLAEALGIEGSGTNINPSGGPLAANVIMGAGLSRIGEVATRITAGDAGRGLAHASSGPCLQQNLVCVLEGDK